MKAKVSVLFVCLGNICRSPTAEAVFRTRAEARGLMPQLHIDSAGTAAYHVGKSPDARATRAGRERGYDLTPMRARQATGSDFTHFDHVLAMDEENLANLDRLYHESGGQGTPPRMFLEFATQRSERAVPDPYYGGADGFEHVLDLCEAAADGLLDHIEQTLQDRAGNGRANGSVGRNH